MTVLTFLFKSASSTELFRWLFLWSWHYFSQSESTNYPRELLILQPTIYLNYINNTEEIKKDVNITDKILANKEGEKNTNIHQKSIFLWMRQGATVKMENVITFFFFKLLIILLLFSSSSSSSFSSYYYYWMNEIFFNILPHNFWWDRFLEAHKHKESFILILI